MVQKGVMVKLDDKEYYERKRAKYEEMVLYIIFGWMVLGATILGWGLYRWVMI